MPFFIYIILYFLLGGISVQCYNQIRVGPRAQCQYSAAHYSVLDSNAVSVFVVILVEFDKYKYKYKYTIRSKSKYQTMSILSGPVLCAGVTFYSADKIFHLLVDRFSTQKVDIFHLPSTFSALFTVSRRNHENERKTSNACKDVIWCSGNIWGSKFLDGFWEEKKKVDDIQGVFFNWYPP